MSEPAPAPIDLRTAHRAETRRRILEAVNALLTEEHPSAVSVPAVARRSGVSLATIYRYFPTKEALLDAAAGSVDEVTWAWLGTEPVVAGGNLREFIVLMWRELSGNLPALRASQVPGLGRDLRLRRSKRRLAVATRTAEAAGIDPATELGQRVIRVILVLASSSALLEQLDRLELPVDLAADDVAWAIATLLAAAGDEQGPAA
jgi:AcrR family transcriptional regulator